MTVVAGLMLLGLSGLGSWRLWVVHRAVTALHADMSSIPKRVDGELNRLWHDVEGLHAEHVKAIEARAQRAESAAAQITREHSHLARHVAWMEPWVQYWATTADETKAPER